MAPPPSHSARGTVNFVSDVRPSAGVSEPCAGVCTGHRVPHQQALLKGRAAHAEYLCQAVHIPGGPPTCHHSFMIHSMVHCGMSSAASAECEGNSLEAPFHQHRVSTLAPGCLHSEAAPLLMTALAAAFHADVSGAGIHPLEGRLPPGHQTAGVCTIIRSWRHRALPMAPPAAGPAAPPHCIASPKTTQHLTMPCNPSRRCCPVPFLASPILSGADMLCAAACAESVGERVRPHTEALRLWERKDPDAWRAQHQLHML